MPYYEILKGPFECDTTIPSCVVKASHLGQCMFFLATWVLFLAMKVITTPT